MKLMIIYAVISALLATTGIIYLRKVGVKRYGFWAILYAVAWPVIIPAVITYWGVKSLYLKCR